MSGTSLDAIDIAYIELVRDVHWSFQILKTKSIEYSKQWKSKLGQAVTSSPIDIEPLNSEYTNYLAHTIKDFIHSENIDDILAVCSHGHTVFHQPNDGYTLQIGNLPHIAQLIGVRTICDFRVQDVLLKGQGAPLVPIGDQMLFPKYDYCLNLGGFANISSNIAGRRIAFDIVPVNVVLNHYSLMLGREYDDGGAFAKAGSINSLLLNKLNQLPFYSCKPPKSLGMEWVNTRVWKMMEAEADPQNALATFTEHIAMKIAAELVINSKVLVTGGGAYNTYLIERILHHSGAQLIIPDPLLIEYKEALIFGLLGVLRLRNEHNCLASVTGAQLDHCSGEIYLPKKS